MKSVLIRYSLNPNNYIKINSLNSELFIVTTLAVTLSIPLSHFQQLCSGSRLDPLQP